MHNVLENLKERYYLENLGVHERIILKRILKCTVSKDVDCRNTFSDPGF
jgi:hypothetical protein